MKNNPEHKQVSLAGAAMQKPDGKAKKPHRRRKWLVWVILLAVLVAAVGGYKLYKHLSAGPSLSGRELVEYQYTPDNQVGHVSYYLLGVTGEKATDRMDMLGLLCLNRDKNTAELLQLPVATWIKDETLFAVNTVGDIWGNPKSVLFCPTCQKRVTADTVSEEKHAACGQKVETRTGSASFDLVSVINRQLGLPVDNYLLIPRAGLAQLIDAVGGVDLKLDKKISYNGVEYEAGTRTLSGEAAVYFVTDYSYTDTPASDVQRMQRQRQLFAGLLSRLSRYKVYDLYNTDPRKMDILSNVMAGRNPVRFDTSSFGKARLTGNGTDASASDTRYTRALAEWVHTVSSVPLEQFTCYQLPGEATRSGAAQVYSTHLSETAALIKEHFDPRGLLSEEYAVAMPELSNKTKSDGNAATLDTLLVPQTEPTTNAPTTTTAAEE